MKHALAVLRVALETATDKEVVEDIGWALNILEPFYQFAQANDITASTPTFVGSERDAEATFGAPYTPH